MKKIGLICTKCGKSYPVERAYPRCDACHEPLELEKVTTGRISEGNVLKQTILERYADFFPFTRIDKALSLHEGFTPLVGSPGLAAELGVSNILFKNETQNPTWSFKDRGTVAGVQQALSLGYRRIGTVSTGNMAVSVAAYGARAGLEVFILVGAGLPPEKLGPIAVYRPVLIRVSGDYGQLYLDSLEIGSQKGIYFINSDVPFRVEGSKTIAFEICEQMNFAVPDCVIVPTSSGGNIRGILKGFEEFKLCGLTGRIPKMVCAQADGCAPIYQAFSRKAEVISPVAKPSTVAHAIENPYPPSGNEVLRRLKANGGTCLAVTDEGILQAQERLAGTGIFGQPAAAVPLAAAKKLREQGYLGRDDTVVCIITGAGLKDTSVLKQRLKIIDSRQEDLGRLVAGKG